MGRYAAETTVSAESSRAEIERILARWGATAFLYGYQGDQAVLGFVAHGPQVRFFLPLPDPTDRRFTMTPKPRQARSPTAAREAYEHPCAAAGAPSR